MKAYLSLDTQSFQKKPERGFIPKIRYRTADNWKLMELSEIADYVGNQGYTMIPAHLENGIKAENCTEMQLFALDFDNGYSFKKIKDKCDQIGIPISFAYNTFSSTLEMEKFRIVFMYEQLVTDPYIIKIIIAMLHKIFPECDQSCKNTDRMFFGGKRLIYLDTNARISLVQLLSPFNNALNTRNNYNRNIREFCNKYKIAMFNNRAMMESYDKISVFGLNDENLETAIIHIIGETKKSSFFIAEKNGVHQSTTYKLEPKRMDLKENCACQLLNDFSNGNYLWHNQKFAIIANLRHVNGGKKYFFDVLRKYGYGDYDKWNRDLYYMNGYMPQRCSESFCPYYDKCESAGTILETIASDRKIYCEEEIYYSLEEATECLKNNLETAFERIGDGIHLIKAQTAIGKTTAYINLIASHPATRFIVALPTNSLKEQVYKDLITKIPKEEVFMTASIHGNLLIPNEIRNAVSEAHQQGLHNQTGKIISAFYEEIKDDVSMSAVAEECQKILNGVRAVETERVIITTHAYLMHIPEEISKHYTVIIDEDILQLQFFNCINQVSLSALQSIIENEILHYVPIARKMIFSKENYYEKITPQSYVGPLTEEQLCELECSSDDNINDLMFAESYVKMKDKYMGELVIKYFCPPKLPTQKYIILSATLNENLYNLYFQGSMNVYFYEAKKAAYMGELIEFTYHSLGRRDLAGKMEVFEFAKKCANNQNLEIITFKENRQLANIGNMNTKNLHFGNTTGINSLSGKDIAVVGTPYKVEEAYKLIACYFGADVNDRADMIPRMRRVKYKSRSFVIVTYKNELLREVQLYSIESELEQCVGRARLLRKNCKVYLFSTFPCEQAILKTVNYLL